MWTALDGHRLLSASSGEAAGSTGEGIVGMQRLSPLSGSILASGRLGQSQARQSAFPGGRARLMRGGALLIMTHEGECLGFESPTMSRLESNGVGHQL